MGKTPLLFTVVFLGTPFLTTSTQTTAEVNKWLLSLRTIFVKILSSLDKGDTENGLQNEKNDTER